MQTGDRTADDASFSDVFDNTSRDSGAETAAPEVKETARDDQGRFAPKPEPEAKAETPPPSPEVEKDPDTNRHVPLRELKTEREKRQSAEKLRDEATARADKREAEFNALMRQLQTQQQVRQPEPQQAAPEIPDPFLDPQGWAAHQQEQAWISNRHAIADMSEAAARRQFGNEAVDKAMQAAKDAGVNRQFWAKAKDPYFEMMDWHKRHEAAQRIGPDPDKFEKDLEAKLREKILSELKSGGTQPQTRFPGSLADATPSGDQGQHLTDEAVAASIFDTNRNRRAS